MLTESVLIGPGQSNFDLYRSRGRYISKQVIDSANKGRISLERDLLSPHVPWPKESREYTKIKRKNTVKSEENYTVIFSISLANCPNCRAIDYS